MDAVGLENFIKLRPPDLLVLASKQLVGGKIAMEILLDVIHAPEKRKIIDMTRRSISVSDGLMREETADAERLL